MTATADMLVTLGQLKEALKTPPPPIVPGDSAYGELVDTDRSRMRGG